MSSKAIALFLALAFAPAFAAAQSASPSASPPMMSSGQMRAHMQIFRQFHDRAEHLHASARAAMLGALSAAHRALLARIVGDLAVASHPNRDAAAQQLDAALSAREKHVILTEASYVKTQMHALVEHMRSQMMSTMTREQRQQVVTMHGRMDGGMAMGMRERHHETPDAGEILLRMATNDHPPMMQFMMVHHPH
jgi:hypothetical protein